MDLQTFYQRVLEAKIRGMMTGNYVGVGNTDFRLSRDFEKCERAFELGYFRKDDEQATAYQNMDEMLADLQAGKQILHFPCPAFGVYSSDRGAFSFDMERLQNVYHEQHYENSLENEVNLQIHENVFKEYKLSDEVAVPAPLGLWDRFVNALSELFLNRPTEAMQNYRNAVATGTHRAAIREAVRQAEEDYRTQNGTYPGDEIDAFSKEMRQLGNQREDQDVVEETNKQEVEAERIRIQEENEKREQERTRNLNEQRKQEREDRFLNGHATSEDLNVLAQEEALEREKLNKSAGPNQEKLQEMENLEMLLGKFDTADGKNTFLMEDESAQNQGEPLSAEQLLDNDLTSAELDYRKAFAIQVSRAQRQAFQEGKNVLLNDYYPLKGKDGNEIELNEELYNEYAYQFRRQAKQFGLLKDLELPERSPEEQKEFEAQEHRRILEEQERQYEEQMRQYRQEHPNSQLEGDLDKQSQLNESFDGIVSDVDEEENNINEVEEAEPEKQLSEFEKATINFEEGLSPKASVSYQHLKKNIESLSTSENEKVLAVTENAKEALNHMILSKAEKYDYTKESAAKDFASLALVQHLAENPNALRGFVESPDIEGYVNRFEKGYVTALSNGEVSKDLIQKISQKDLSVIPAVLGDNLYQVGPERKTLTLSDMVQNGIVEYKAKVAKEEEAREVSQYSKEHQEVFKKVSINTLKENAQKVLPDLSKESLKNTNYPKEAQEAVDFMLNKVMLKKNGVSMDNPFDKGKIELSLIKIASYQSLDNIDYDTAHQSLCMGQGNEGTGIYEEMIAEQIQKTGIVDQIAKDVTKCASFVFNPQKNFFKQVEEMNLKAKDGVTFTVACDHAIERRVLQKQGLDEQIQQFDQFGDIQDKFRQDSQKIAQEILSLSDVREELAEGLNEHNNDMM